MRKLILRNSYSPGDIVVFTTAVRDLHRAAGINDERISLQLAADAEWPHTSATNIPIRREFQLPTRSGFNV